MNEACKLRDCRTEEHNQKVPTFAGKLICILNWYVSYHVLQLHMAFDSSDSSSDEDGGGAYRTMENSNRRSRLGTQRPHHARPSTSAIPRTVFHRWDIYLTVLELDRQQLQHELHNVTQ